MDPLVSDCDPHLLLKSDRRRDEKEGERDRQAYIFSPEFALTLHCQDALLHVQLQIDATPSLRMVTATETRHVLLASGVHIHVTGCIMAESIEQIISSVRCNKEMIREEEDKVCISLEMP